MALKVIQCAVENMFSILLHLSLWADNECKYLFPLPLSLWAAKERVFRFSFLCRYGQIMNVFVLFFPFFVFVGSQRTCVLFFLFCCCLCGQPKNVFSFSFFFFSFLLLLSLWAAKERVFCFSVLCLCGQQPRNVCFVVPFFFSLWADN